MKLTDNAMFTLTKRILAKDPKTGEVIETPDQMIHRVVGAVAEAEKLYLNGEENYRKYYDDFYKMINNLDFLPNSPTLVNAGRPLGQLSACFVLPIEDNMRSIFQAVGDTALIHQTGGGTGFSFSRLRSKDSRVSSTGGTASGPISFMQVFNQATEVIKQGGCFKADTLIATAHGPKKIKDLKKGDLVYSWDHETGMVLRPCSGSWITKRNVEVWELVTDKGLQVVATPDHPILMRSSNGKNKVYKKLADLKPGASIMPLTRYTKTHHGVEEVWITLQDGRDTRLPEHIWMAHQLGYETAGMHVHHRDFDHMNNDPDNIVVLTPADHAKIHAAHAIETGDYKLANLPESVRRKATDALQNYHKNMTPEERERYIAKLKEGVKGVNQFRIVAGTHNFINDPPMRNPKSSKKAKRSRVARAFWRLMEMGHLSDLKDLTVEKWNTLKGELPQQLRYTADTIISLFGSFDGALEYADARNNKVVSVKPCGRCDVWNVEVEDTHNYVVCNDDMTTGIVVSNTRRGANMGILRVDHPDIMEFITCKNDLTSLNNFNLSVAITDAFMSALTADTTYDLVDPHTNEVTATPMARDVWDAIVTSAWNTGEPGIVFIDRVNKYNTLRDAIGPIESTNPCVAGWTRITTDKGEVEIRDVVDQEVNVWNGEVFSTVTPRVTGENQECLIIGLSGYDPIFCTHYHKFITATGARVEAKDLKVGDVLAAWNTPKGTVENTMVTYITNGPVLDKVYCFTEPLRHMGMFNGVITGNCGEQPLLPYESCNLGSINLTKFVYWNAASDRCCFDYARLGEVTKLATRFLDDVIDVNKYPLREIDVRTHGSRKIGLGVMGFADTLLMMGVPYDSEEGLSIASVIMQTINDASHAASVELAKERGQYPYWINASVARGVAPMRNNTTTTIAPTGTLSIIAGVSSGIEPVFAYAFYRKVLDDDKLAEVNPILMETLRLRNLDTPEIIDEIITKGSLAHVDAIPDDIKRVFVCSHDISPEWHVRMQAAFQKYVDNAVSKTVNFTHDATKENIDTVYRLAYTMGCKGVTVYRDGSRSGQTLNIGKVDEKKAETLVEQCAETTVTVVTSDGQKPRDRDEILEGFTRKVRIGCGKLYVTVNHDSQGICEVFTTNGKAGGCPSQSEAVARVSSLALRAGVSIDDVIDQLKGIRCQSCIHRDGVNVLSCPDAIAKQLELAKVMVDMEHATDTEHATFQEYQEMTSNAKPATPAPDEEIPLAKNMSVCPNCGTPLEHEGGCVICRNCGASKCG